MNRVKYFLVAWVVLGIFTISPAMAAGVIVGVNVVAVAQMSDQKQDELIAELQKDGVKIIRTALGGKNDGYINFIIKAFQHGISTIVMVSPNAGGSNLHISKQDPSAGRGWAMPALSDADPEEFRKWLTPELAKLESAGVRLVAFEFGNEINMTWDNADFPVPNSGRVLGITDLNNPNDAEASSVAAGFRAYVKVMAVLKDMRDPKRRRAAK